MTEFSTVANGIADVLGSLELSDNLTVYTFENVPGGAGMPKLPAAEVELPNFTGHGVEEGDSELGSTDWFLSYTVRFWFDMQNASKALTKAAEYVDAFIKAVQADPSLNGTAFDAAITRGDLEALEVGTGQSAREVLTYTITLETLRLVRNV